MTSILGVMTLICLFRAQTQDPGILPLDLSPPKDFGRPAFCSICGSWKPPRAHHSRMLGRCVFRMDHACKWINNIVGYSNQKFFILLLLYAMALGAWNALVSLGFVLSYCLGGSCSAVTPMHLLFLSLNAVGFIILKSYFSEQVEFMESNVTLIETFQNCRGRSDGIDVFRQVFGNNPWFWIFPVNTTLQPDYTEQVLSSTLLSAKDAYALGVELTDRVDSRPDRSKLD